MEDKLIVLSQSQLEETINNAVSRILGEMQKTDVKIKSISLGKRQQVYSI